MEGVSLGAWSEEASMSVVSGDPGCRVGLTRNWSREMSSSFFASRVFLVRRADPHPTPAEFGLLVRLLPLLVSTSHLIVTRLFVTFFEVGGFDHLVVGREKFMAAEMSWDFWAAV